MQSVSMRFFRHLQALARIVAIVLAVAAMSIVDGADGGSHADGDTPRPKLQIINGSASPVDIFWMARDGRRVPNGTILAGDDTIITTTLGHRFAIVPRDGSTERVVTSRVRIQGIRFDPSDPDGVPSFYTRRTDAGGFPIVASETVNPFALREAAHWIDQMLESRDDLREALIESGARLCILGYNEFTTELPEFAHLGAQPVRGFEAIDPRDYWDARARGTGGSEHDPYCSCGEENLLAYPGDPYATEFILIHEFAHCIHLRGMNNIDATFDARLREAYTSAMQKGLWATKYASVNHHEYFAEGTQCWFDNNRENDHDHNDVNTRAELVQYDPGLADICREVFGSTKLAYTKPSQRLSGHLEGFDPSTSPTFSWPPRLRAAKQAIHEQATTRGKPGG